MQIINIEQHSEEWFKLRELKMTASNAQAIASAGKGLETYIKKLCQEYYSTAEAENYSNKHTERGNELEDSAGFLYEIETGFATQRVGFVKHNEFVGCSPDLFVEDDGLCEIKCPDDKGFFEILIENKIPSKYDWQMQMQMLICEKAWCDFVCYNPNFEKKIIIIRTEPDQKKFEKLRYGFEKGQAEIMKIKSIIGSIK